MKRKPLITSLCVGLLVALGACGDGATGDDPTTEVPTDLPGPTEPPAQFLLTFTGDASFQGPHPGQTLTEVLTDASGLVMASGSGPILGPPNTVSWIFGLAVNAGETYQYYYWIDSNFSGGTMGVCDPPAIDHQWTEPVPTVTEDVTIILSHDPATVTDVCSIFAGLP